MKRSRSIRLVLIGGLSAEILTGCDQGRSSVTANNVYTNNYFVPGAGYYHAPFRSWYSLPYNHFDAQNGRYFFGGQWGTAPHQSITNVSEPTPEAAAQAQNTRTDVRRGGFGTTSHSHWIHA
jgi:hypothetical protein